MKRATLRQRSRQRLHGTLVRNVISRTTMMLVGLAITYCGIRCIRWSGQHEADRAFLSSMVRVIGFVLLLPGGACAIVALIPAPWLYRIGPNDLPDARDAASLLEMLN